MGQQHRQGKQLSRVASGEEAKQRLRLRMVGTAAASYGTDVLVLALFAAVGSIPLSAAGSYAAAAAAASVVFVTLIRTGANLRFVDPSLTLPQMLACCAIQLGFAAALPDLTVLFLVNLFVAFAFGVMQLGRGEFLFACGLVAAALYVLLARGVPPGPIPAGNGSEALVFWFFVTVALARFTVISIFASGLRAALHRRNRELRDSLARIEDLATRDHLTHLFNRRHMEALMNQELARMERGGPAFCLAMVDIDHFKAINDGHGHDVGDRVLVEFGRLLPASLREVDQVARWGGEEFVLLLVATSVEHGATVVERLCSDVRTHDWAAAAIPVSPTCSIGIAEREPGESLDSVLRRADAALYSAKQAGRDRVMADAGRRAAPNPTAALQPIR